MTSKKETLLEEAYKAIFQMAVVDFVPDRLSEFAAEDVMGYGTTIDEKILDMEGLRKLLSDQMEQSAGAELKLETKPVMRKISSDGNVAIFVDEMNFKMLIDGNTHTFDCRVSWILEFRNGKWMLIHWHGSRPVEIVGDTFHKDEWKKKNEELQNKVDEKTAELRKSLSDLKATQTQLIQSEKMASLGELTAGIAHEIQNPLNFVNNFSEVNKELLGEMNEEIKKGNFSEVSSLAKDITANEDKINHHGKRADAIVKGMLQHSRNSSGVKEPTDINALADEYLRLAYHGLRAKDKSFNATLKTDYDEAIGNISVIPQDIGRVVLNLITNAFYAVTEKRNLSAGSTGQPYEPTVSVSTKKVEDRVFISVKDNGPDIPQKVLDKIFQPFFTTKPTGQGTGLGLSLSYDIVRAHGGELRVETEEGVGSEFTIQLPV